MTALTKKPRVVTGDPRTLKLLDVNARYMTNQQFRRLCANVKADGYLTSLPLVWLEPESGDRIVLSGNHRTKAAVEVGLAEIDWYEIDEPLPRQKQLALQLSHNSLTGQDDPAVLKSLYEEIESIDLKEYAALDDKTLDLLAKVDLASLGESNLDLTTIQLLFLPHEVERAEATFTKASELFKVDGRWLVAEEEFDRVIDALDTARGAFDVKNTAAAFGMILDVFEASLDQLADGWWDSVNAEPRNPKKWVPVETVLGARQMPSEAAGLFRQVVDKMRRDGDLSGDGPVWQVLELLAADYLAGE